MSLPHYYPVAIIKRYIFLFSYNERLRVIRVVDIQNNFLISARWMKLEWHVVNFGQSPDRPKRLLKHSLEQ